MSFFQYKSIRKNRYLLSLTGTTGSPSRRLNKDEKMVQRFMIIGNKKIIKIL